MAESLLIYSLTTQLEYLIQWFQIWFWAQS